MRKVVIFKTRFFAYYIKNRIENSDFLSLITNTHQLARAKDKLHNLTKQRRMEQTFTGPARLLNLDSAIRFLNCGEYKHSRASRGGLALGCCLDKKILSGLVVRGGGDK
jgi:hypothetical protein